MWGVLGVADEDGVGQEAADQWVKDLLQLCTDFESMESRVTLGVSLALKLKTAPSALSGLISKYLGPDTHYWTGATAKSRTKQVGRKESRMVLQNAMHGKWHG